MLVLVLVYTRAASGPFVLAARMGGRVAGVPLGPAVFALSRTFEMRTSTVVLFVIAALGLAAAIGGLAMGGYALRGTPSSSSSPSSDTDLNVTGSGNGNGHGNNGHGNGNGNGNGNGHGNGGGNSIPAANYTDAATCCTYTAPNIGLLRKEVDDFVIDTGIPGGAYFAYFTGDFADFKPRAWVDLETPYATNAYVNTYLGQFRTRITSAMNASTNTLEKVQLRNLLKEIDYVRDLHALDGLRLQEGIWAYSYAWTPEPFQIVIDVLETFKASAADYNTLAGYDSRITQYLQYLIPKITRYNTSYIRQVQLKKVHSSAVIESGWDLSGDPTAPIGYMYFGSYNYAAVCDTFYTGAASPNYTACVTAGTTINAKMAAFGTWFENVYRPACATLRPDTRPGYWNVTDGPAMYAALERYHLGTAPNNTRVYALGQSAMAELLTDLDALYPLVDSHLPESPPLNSRAEAIAAMSDPNDPRFYICTQDPQEAIDFTAAQLNKVTALITEAFGFFSRAPTFVTVDGTGTTGWGYAVFDTVRKMWTAGAHYNTGVLGLCGSSASAATVPHKILPKMAHQRRRGASARYMVSDVPEEDAPYMYFEKFSALSTAAHEASPGHGLQVPLAMEIECAITDSRASIGSNVKAIEGWGMHGERVMLRLGLYVTVLEQMGFIANRLLRANRLRADTCLNVRGLMNASRGCTLDEAVALGLEAGLAYDYAVSEMVRYVQMPAQALGYYLGDIDLEALRVNTSNALVAAGLTYEDSEFYNVILRFGGGDVDLHLTPLMATYVKYRRFGLANLTTAD